jgi:hypothetical protein
MKKKIHRRVDFFLGRAIGCLPCGRLFHKRTGCPGNELDFVRC